MSNLPALLNLLNEKLVDIGLSDLPYLEDDCPSPSSLTTDKVFVVTGGNSGLGLETAKSFSLQSSSTSFVVLGCRNHEKCLAAKEEIDNARRDACFTNNKEEFISNVYVPTASLDLNKPSTLQNWVDSLTSLPNQNSPITYISHLVLNAGIMSTPLYPLNAETGMENQIQVNHFSQYSLTSLLLPYMKKSAVVNDDKYKTRIVVVASVAAQFPLSWNIDDVNFQNGRYHSSMIAYGQSKRANLLFVEYLKKTTHEKYGIEAIACHPGYSRTNLFHAEGSWSFLPSNMNWLKDIASSPMPISMSSAEGARMSIRSALDSSVKNGDYVTPMYYIVGEPVISIRKNSIMETAVSWVPGLVGRRLGDYTWKDVQGLIFASERVSGGLKID